MVDIGSLVLLMSIFGTKVAVVYVLLGLVIAVVGGTLIEKLHLENRVEEFIRNAKQIDIPQEELAVKDRIKYGGDRLLKHLKKSFHIFLLVLESEPISQLDTGRYYSEISWYW